GWWDFSDTTTLYNATSGGSNVTTDGSSVSRVNDKSGNGKNIVAVGAATYKTNIANGRGIVRFNGTSHCYQATSFPYFDTAYSAFVVCKTTAYASTFQAAITGLPATNAAAPNADYFLLSLQDTSASSQTDRYGYGGTNSAAASTASRTAFTVYGVSCSANASALSVNGTGVATGTAINLGKSVSGTVSDIPSRVILNVGALVRPANPTGVAFWPGDMCEIVWYSSDISSSDKSQLVTWLMSKWGIA
ncbi:MAG: hypothetical protein EBR82_86125, partial [Caulobacteraceae bacterium]|nr:hypothetical protein [Caulobacteraceae bacterium]